MKVQIVQPDIAVNVSMGMNGSTVDWMVNALTLLMVLSIPLVGLKPMLAQ